MTILTFPTRPLRIAETAPAGRHGYPEPADRDRIEITGGLSKVYAVRIDGAVFAEFNTATNALRCREHLIGLAGLGALPMPGQLSAAVAP
jgi:hypothetical protein